MACLFRIGLFLLLCQAAEARGGFKWMANIKSPSLMNHRMKKIGQKFGDKKLVVITGTSSGLGLATTKALLRTDKYHVIGAVRDLEKMSVVAEVEGFNMSHFTPMLLELNSFDSLNKFVQALDDFRGDRPIDRLACNAAVYQPTLAFPKWSEDGHEQQLQTNYLSHFLLTSKIVPMMDGSDDARIVMLGSVTGNDNTVGGGGVYPIADLKELVGLELGCKKPIAMMDGYNFNGAKAYKDTKLACMMMANMLHERFHRSTGIAFSSVYPGCIAETPLFREKRPWFRKLFPVFMKYITGGYVGEEEAGQRLFQVLHDPRCTKSGVYWSWNGGPREGRQDSLEKGGQITGAGGAGGGWDSIYENDQSDKVLNAELTMKLWEYSTEVTGADWAKAFSPKSPCPTLKVVGAATSLLGRLEERARMKVSRKGDGGKVISDHSLPKELRRKSLEEMLQALDLTPDDPEIYEQDMQRTSGMAPDLKTSYLDDSSLRPIAAKASVDDLVAPDLDDLVFDDEEKEPPQMIPGHEQFGDVPVVFQPSNVMTMATVGQPLSEVASRADVFIKYKCRKGECKTCAVNIGGKWVCACQTKIPAQAPGQQFGVRVRPVSEKQKDASKAAFFSPKSIADGLTNNVMGMVGFAKEGFQANPDFEVRMERERRIAELTARKAKHASTSLRGVQADSDAEQNDDKMGLKMAGVAAVSGLVLAVAQSASAGMWQ